MLTVNNNSTSFSPHYTVKDIFYGYTPAERLTWFVTARIPVMMPVTGRIDFNYLQLDRDVTPHTFNRLFYSIFGKFGETIYIDIDRATPFSFYLAGSTLNNLISVQFTDNLISQVKSFTTLTGQATNRLFIDELDDVISTWGFVESINTFLPTPSTTFVTTTFKQTPIHHLYAATNKIWNNSLITGINDSDDSKYYKGDDYVFNRYFKLNAVEDDLFNEDDMTNPYTLEIHKSLNAGKYSKNELSPDEDRITTLGWLINRQAEVLGIRYNANGKIDKDKEKKLAREMIPSGKVLDQKKYGGSCFGDEKLLVRRLNNHFGKDGVESGGVVGVADLPQLMLEVLDQLNLSLGVQESSAIEIKHDGQTHRYPNLLALVTEIAIHQFNQSQYSKSTHISSLVTQQQTGEIIGGLGLPTVSKQLLRTVNGNNAAIPYWGIAPQASLAKKIDTCTYNVGLVLGQVT